ncbi:MAG: glycerol-3-phosphate acyltransferase [Pseudomonadota bacterium]|nr:glycerol-3-phosphate acyltransferase [Pseudomonadota bacterium]
MPEAPLAPLSWLLIVVAYLLGSLSGGRLLGRWRGIAATPVDLGEHDLREHDDGKADAANTSQPGGFWFAAGVVLIDVAKGALAAWLALRYAPVASGLSVTGHGYLAAFAAILGHVWPLWHRFRGGKGAATLVGGLLVLWPFALPVLVAAWFLVVIVSGHVGLATVLAAAALPLLAGWSAAGTPRWWFACAVLVLLVFTHRDHLTRLHAGTESRFARARWLHRFRRRG